MWKSSVGLARADAEKRVGVCGFCSVKEMLPGHLGRERRKQ